MSKYAIVIVCVAALTVLSCKNENNNSKAPAAPGFSFGYNKNYEPDQPIPYDHSLHAGTYKIPCMYCHSNADRSRHATVPSLNVCMNCHMTVGSDKPNVQKLQEHFNKNIPIVWNKVHLLPDFVMFNHKPHIRKGVNCQECHGPIETMKKVKQHSDLSMGWCVDCHRRNNAPTNCSTCHN
ncbi:MAG: cytochrome C [Proteobacteria bacterium SG_bin7]|nr:MAG: cytochrome C [Proteobacteria bacterium SG_bin7]